MNAEHAPAAGQGGLESNPAPEAQHTRSPQADQPPDHEPPDCDSDEDLRRRAASLMAQHLESGLFLIGRCEQFSMQPKGNRVAPIHAAARLLHADAHVALALGNLAKVERRQHTIIEHIQPPAPVLKDSNSKTQPLAPQDELMYALQEKMLRYMKLVADETFDPPLKEAEENAKKKADSSTATEADIEADTPPA